MGLDLQSAQYGSPIPVIFGQNKVAGNVIWYGDFKAIGHQQKQPGKGGGGGSSGTTYTYSSSYMLGLCEGPASIVNVYDGSSVKSLSSVGGIGFTGTLGQAPWAHLSGVQAIGYSGTALAAFQNKDLGSSASLPNYNFEMAGRNQVGGGILDANPADIVTGICADTQIGVNFSALGDLTQYRTYCTAAGLFFSPTYDTQQTATQTLEDLFKYSNSAPYFSEGVLKVVPYGDATITGNGSTFTPNVTAVADLGRDDFITNGPGDPVTVKRIGPADAMNIVRVEYKDRANTYHTSTVIASIDQDVVGTGARADQSESVDMITTAAVARLVSQNLLQRIYYIRNTYEFQLSWRYCYLEPMDVVTLTDANTGLYLTPVRITEVSEDEHGLLSIVAEEFPDGVSHGGIYATQANAGATVDTDADPGAVDGPYLFRGPGFLVSNNQPEIWCALSGNDPMWAGCDVYMSHDGTSYTYLSTHSRRASYGLLTNTLPSVADPDTTSAPNVVLNGPAQLLGGTTADADQFITLSMVDQEIIAYQTATLAGGPSYTLGYLRRGGYGSAIAAHAINAPFVRLDENILRIPVDPSQIGQTVYLKFVSFNVFGKGGRTLADETAYTYVVGTNVELPDVPITPASFTATGVADGVSLTWTNPNPAAVGCTSIEYATSSGGPWTVLAQVGPTTTAYVHHFTTGATYFYRARSRGPLVAAGFSAYTATVTNTGTNVGDISSNAITAVGQVTQLPVINGGFDIAPTGYGWTADAGTGWFTDTTNVTPGVGPNCARHNGGSPDGAYRNNGLAACNPGQRYKAQALIKAAGANGVAYVYISWCNAAGGEIGTTTGNFVTGTATAGSYADGVAPAGTVYARTCLAAGGHTTGYYAIDNVVCTQYPASIGEMPDGGGYQKSPVMSGSSVVVGNANFEAPIDSMGNIPGWTPVNGGTIAYDTTTPYSGTQCLEVTGHGTANFGARTAYIQCSAGDSIAAQCMGYGVSGNAAALAVIFLNQAGVITGPLLDFGTAYGIWQLLKGSAVAPAGTTYAYVEVINSNTGGISRFDEVRVSRNDVRVAGSGARLGDMRNQVMVGVGNYGAGWSGGGITYSASSTSATITAAAATLQLGSSSLAYNSANVTVSGSAGLVRTYYLYYDDDGYTGGSKTLNATTSQITSLAANGRILVGQVTVTFPTSGTGSGGGGTGCPVRTARVVRRVLGGEEEIAAGAVVVGDRLKIIDPMTGTTRWGTVSMSKPAYVDCVRVVQRGGVTLSCSVTAPLGCPDGVATLAPDALGRPVTGLDAGALVRADIVRVAAIGKCWVQHITCEDDFFLAGDQPGRYLAHHNLKPP